MAAVKGHNAGVDITTKNLQAKMAEVAKKTPEEMSAEMEMLEKQKAENLAKLKPEEQGDKEKNPVVQEALQEADRPGTSPRPSGAKVMPLLPGDSGRF